MNNPYITKNIIFNYIILYPLVHLIFAMLFQGEGLAKLYFVYSTFIFFIIFIIKLAADFLSVKKSTVLILALIALEGILLVLFVTQDKFSILEYIQFSICIIFFILFSSKEYIHLFLKYLFQKDKILLIVQIVYFLFLSITVINGQGIDAGRWDAMTLKGPYDMAHILAYELFIFLLIDIIYLYNSNNKFLWLMLCILWFICILLTAVRSVLLSLAFVLFFAFRKIKTQHKILLSLAFGIFLIGILKYTTVFDNLINKTIFAINNGTITSSRGLIFKNSLAAYFNTDNIFQYLTGIGLENLEKYNKKYIYMAIHAHNDFIDALVQFGPIGLILYIKSFYMFIKSIKGQGSIIAFTIIFSLAFYNGFFINGATVICMIIITAYSYKIRPVKYEVNKNEDINYKPVYSTCTSYRFKPLDKIV